jgi:hypothetical protein
MVCACQDRATSPGPHSCQHTTTYGPELGVNCSIPKGLNGTDDRDGELVHRIRRGTEKYEIRHSVSRLKKSRTA